MTVLDHSPGRRRARGNPPPGPGRAAARSHATPSPSPDTPSPPGGWRPRADPSALLPDRRPFHLLGTGARVGRAEKEVWRELYRQLVRGRRFNQQATALTKQGRLAVYPSSTGQEACQVAAALALEERDWLFPSYRDTLAAVARGIDPVRVLGLLRGDWHSGYDPFAHRTAPLATPLATQLPHAVGLAHAARLRGDGVVALALVGDGGTSEGDFHEALNFAAVWRAPVVFLVQNNGYAISVPLAQQTAAPSLAHKAIGYGMPGRLVDGNDAPATHRVLSEAVARARIGDGPTLVEAVTYRVDAHTNADDASRYRDADEVVRWQRHDPVRLLEDELRRRRALTAREIREAGEAAEELAAGLRDRLNAEPTLDEDDLFAHVYATPTPQLAEQAAALRAERAAEADDAGGHGPPGRPPTRDSATGDPASGGSVTGDPAGGGSVTGGPATGDPSIAPPTTAQGGRQQRGWTS